MDYSKLSNEELLKLAGSGGSDYSKMSDADLLKAAGMDSQQKPEEFSKLGSAGLGALSGATLGYAPQIYGAAKKLVGGDYLKSRDEAAAYLNKASQDNPISYGTGSFGGGLASLALGGGLIGGGAAAANGLEGLATRGALESLGRGAVKGAVSGAALGAVSNPGDVKGQYGGLQLPERAGAATFGAAVGAPLGAIGGYIGQQAKISKAAQMAPDEMQSDLRSIIDKGTASIQSKKIDPAMDAARTAAKAASSNEQSPYIPYNTKRLSGFSEKVISPDTGQQLNNHAFSPDLTGSGRVSISVEEALPIKQKLDELANIARNPSASNETKAANELAFGEANTLRSGINKLSPETSAQLKIASENIRLKNGLDDLSRDPIGGFNPRGGVGATLSGAQKATGIDYPGIARTVRGANPVDLSSNVLHWPSLALRKVGRGAGYVASKVPQGLPIENAILLQIAKQRAESNGNE